MNAPKVAVCGVRYSSNLGDGVISDCLGWMIKQCVANVAIADVDLAGRTEFGEQTVAQRRLKLRLLLSLPRVLQDALVRFVLGRKLQRDLKPSWRASLTGCSAALIGGGQLLSDSDLNFPLKIEGLVDILEELKVPAAVYACGVTRSGGSGTQVLRESLAASSIRSVYVRDQKSMAVIRDFGVDEPHLAYDPAIHVAEAYEHSRATEADLDVGLSFTDPVNMKYSSGRELPFADHLPEIMKTVVEALSSAGSRVGLFTNGAVEDEQFLDHCDASFQFTSLPGVQRLPRPIEPSELVQSIGRFRKIAAHRLHTNIIAFGLGIPSVGLEWSQKVPHFFELAGRSEFLIGKDELTSDRMLDRLDSLTQDSANAHRLVEMKQDSLGMLRQAIKTLGITVRSVNSIPEEEMQQDG
ncbi:MAG: polysaccharide pyruvyl transferase family protein [Planctomycetota bacterium]